MAWLRDFLYWWRTVPCPYMCGGRLPREGNQDRYYEGLRLSTQQDRCPNCGRTLQWYTGYSSYWQRAEPLKPNPVKTA